MIKRLQLSKKDQVSGLVEFLKHSYSPDFYFTKNNQRIYIETEKHLRQLVKECKEIWISDEGAGITGIIVLWTASGGNIKRNYVKMAAKNGIAADKLLTVLLWNYNKETFIKINKKSTFLRLFYQKGYKFLSGRGKQLLLKRNRYIIKSRKRN